MLWNATPSQIDLFFRFLEKKSALIAVCAFFERLMDSSENFDATQACLYKFIKVFSLKTL